MRKKDIEIVRKEINLARSFHYLIERTGKKKGRKRSCIYDDENGDQTLLFEGFQSFLQKVRTYDTGRMVLAGKTV